jgi:hypothetical protein
MWDKWCEASYDVLWTRSPCIDTKIDHTINDKCEDNSSKYLERYDFIGVIFLFYTIEPEPYEEKCDENDDGFTEDLYEYRI